MPPESFSQQFVALRETTSSINMRKRQIGHDDSSYYHRGEQAFKKKLIQKNVSIPENYYTNSSSSFEHNQKRQDTCINSAKRNIHSTDTSHSPITKRRRTANVYEQNEEEEQKSKTIDGTQSLMMVPYSSAQLLVPSENSLTKPRPVRYQVCDRVMPKLLGDWRPAVEHEYPLIVYHPPEHPMYSQPLHESSNVGVTYQREENSENQVEEKDKYPSSHTFSNSSLFSPSDLNNHLPCVTSKPSCACEITQLDEDEDVMMDL